MAVAGIDIGSRTSKAVILNDGRVRGYSLIRTGPEQEKVAKEALGAALQAADLAEKSLDFIVATGYGRVMVPFASKQISEISCHAKGAVWLFPTVRTILDMGGQDCKAIRCNERGQVINFVMNDKCAAGTGRFLEHMAAAFDLPLEEIGPISLEVGEGVSISSTCTVFARSEALILAREGIPRNRIFAGLLDALTDRVLTLVGRVHVQPDFAITGGIAKNVGFVRRIESRLGMKALMPEEPQITGAIGAAVLAMEERNKGTESMKGEA
jgi:predicted CoA-substrate-specific enzyme activase